MRYKKLIIGTLMVIVLAIVAISINQTLAFHLVKSSPKDQSNPNQYTVVSFNFNQKLADRPGVNELSVTPLIDGHFVLKDKQVQFIPTTSFKAGTRYTAKLSRISSQDGKTLPDINISFTPVFMNFADLPEDVQKRLIAQTDVKEEAQTRAQAYSADSIAISGSENLLKQGMTAEQLDSLRYGLYKYFQSKNIEVRSVGVSNISFTLHNLDDIDPKDKITFNVKFSNNSGYTGKVEYSGLSDLHFILYKPDKSTEFDFSN